MRFNAARMRAWIKHEGRLQLREVADPVPRSNELLVRVEAFSLNRGATGRSWNRSCRSWNSGSSAARPCCTSDRAGIQNVGRGFSPYALTLRVVAVSDCIGSMLPRDR